MKSSFKLRSLLFAAAPFTFAVTCEDTFGVCEAGCFNQDNTLLPDGRSHCVPTRPGFYSPLNSNLEHPCPAGRFSADYGAASCDLCPAGTSGASIALSICPLCPSGSYQDLEGQVTCNDCVPGYSGEGADSFVFSIVTNNLECARTMMAPSPSPVTSVTPISSTIIPSSIALSMEPSLSPSVFPTRSHRAKSSSPTMQGSSGTTVDTSSTPTLSSSSFSPTVKTSSEEAAPAQRYSQSMLFFLVGIGVFIAVVVFSCCWRSYQQQANDADDDEDLPVVSTVTAGDRGPNDAEEQYGDIEKSTETDRSDEEDEDFVDIDLTDDTDFDVQKHIGNVRKDVK